MSDAPPTPSSNCACNLSRGGDIREYQLPPGAMDTFALYHPPHGSYEHLYRCTVCRQFWHQSVTGGHATIEIFNQVDEKVAAALVASEEAAALTSHWRTHTSKTRAARPVIIPRIKETSLVHNHLEDYRPPASREELERRYAAGERRFPRTELMDADLSGITLDGADFEMLSWFSSADFSGASLRGTNFRECNLKCANFSNADLTGAIFEDASIESIKATGAVLDGIKATGASFYGYSLAEGDALPSWEW
jgi:Pentapeptide repeats (8 copies)